MAHAHSLQRGTRGPQTKISPSEERTPLLSTISKKNSTNQRVSSIITPIDDHIEARKALAGPSVRVPSGRNPFGDQEMVGPEVLGRAYRAGQISASFNSVIGLVARYLPVGNGLNLRRLSKIAKESYDTFFPLYLADLLGIDPQSKNRKAEFLRVYRALNQALFRKSPFGRKAKKLTPDELKKLKGSEEDRSFKHFCYEISVRARQDPFLSSTETFMDRFEDSGFLDAIAKISSLSLRYTWTFLPSQIGKLSSLKSLTLTNLGLKTFPPEIFSLSKLEDLTIIEPSVVNQVLPSGIGKIANLKRLILKGNFTEIPPDIGDLKKLESLSIIGTNIFTWMKKVTQIHGLIPIRSEDDMLERFIKSLFSVCTVPLFTFLIVPVIGVYHYRTERRSFDQLPESLGNLSNLNHFELQWSRVTDLPESMSCLENLQEISLTGNHRLGCLPKQMARLSKLNRITLGDFNRDTVIHPALETRDGMQIQQLPFTMMTDFKNRVQELGNPLIIAARRILFLLS